MKVVRALALLGSLLAVLVLASPASAAGWGARWEMNETSGPMVDSSGNGNNLSSIGPGIRRNGSSYYFASPAQVPNRGVITVPDSATLRPGTRAFSISARVKPQYGDKNIVQKGTYSPSGNQWKLEIVDKSYNCVFKGSNGDFRVGNATGVHGTVKAGVWQTVTCRRTSNSIELVVDGTVRASRSANPGTISTWGKAATIGGKPNCSSNCDLYTGYIDWIHITSP